MTQEYQYVNIREVLSRALRHPMLENVTLEQAVQYVIDFQGIFGFTKIYAQKEEIIHIKDHRGLLPCDLISIIQVQDNKTHLSMRAMTSSFLPKGKDHNPYLEYPEWTYKTQGRVIFTSFKEGDITIVYKSIPVDEDGFPLLIDNPVYLRTLESYIKKQAFTILYDLGKIGKEVKDNTYQEYAWNAGQLHSEFIIPTVAEMESIKNMWNTLLQKPDMFYKGFKDLGKKEIYYTH